MTAAPTPSQMNALQAKAEEDAITLVQRHIIDLVHSSEGTPEATVRLLAARGFLTTPELRNAEKQQTISLNRVFNHVPVDKHKAEVRRYRRYVEALERVTHVLTGQLNAVCGLAAVKKTATGRTAAEQNERAQDFLEKAHKAWAGT